MDVDVTQPAQNTGRRHPLIIMLHGFGNNKHEWESRTDEGDDADKYHWNNRWFAKHGYYVLNYTARGFRDDGPTADYQPSTPASPSGSVSAPNGTLHLKSRDWEIRDTQWLAALVAKTYPDVDPKQVAVTGGSYGGIESWLQASQAQWTFPKSQDPSLPLLDLQVAIPKYPSTDLSYSLAPNGHGGGGSGTDVYESSQGEEDSDVGDGHPIGTGKLSYVAGLYALGTTRGVFETGSSIPPGSCTYDNCESPPPISIPAWNVRAAAGDPYDTCQEDPGWTECYETSTDEIVKQFRRGLTEFRGSYYQDEGWDAQEAGRKVAVFSIQGWTDDLFTAVESFRQFKSLKRRDSRWPVAVAVADVGHSRAQNKPATWHRLNVQAFQWLQSHINGSHERQTTVASQQTTCPNDGEPDNNLNAAMQVTASTPEELAKGTLTVKYPPGFTGGSAALTDPNGPATDAVVGERIFPDKCRTSEGPAEGGYTAYSPPLRDTTTYIGIGAVHVPYTTTGATTTATLNARLWDKAPGKNCSGDEKNDQADDTTQRNDGKEGDSPQATSPTDDTSQSDDGADGDTGVPNLTDTTVDGDDLPEGDSPQLPSPPDDTTPSDEPKDGDSAQPPAPTDTGSGCELLITRGTYRVNHLPGASGGVLELPFYGNHWRLRPGHQIRLDLTQVDQPTYQPSKPESLFQFPEGVTLTLPTLESRDATLEASADEFPPILPDLSTLPNNLAEAIEKVVGEIVGTINGVTGTVEEITRKDNDVTDPTGNTVEDQLPSDDPGAGDGDGGGTDDDGDGTESGDGGSDNGPELPSAGVP